LTELNLTAWFVLTLCDGRPAAALQAAFREAIGARTGAAQAEDFLRQALFQLIGASLVRRSATSDTTNYEESRA
jgi:hypothetical protein